MYWQASTLTRLMMQWPVSSNKDMPHPGSERLRTSSPASGVDVLRRGLSLCGRTLGAIPHTLAHYPQNLSRILLALSLTLTLTLFSACDDVAHESPVPAGSVHYTCDVQLVNLAMEQATDQVTLESPGGYVRLYDRNKMLATDSWGTGGLLLVHGIISTSSYYAYDLACPWCYQNNGRGSIHQLSVDPVSHSAYCSDCESEFGAVFWGSPSATKGPANEEGLPLRQYHATPSGDKLIVTN